MLVKKYKGGSFGVFLNLLEFPSVGGIVGGGTGIGSLNSDAEIESATRAINALRVIYKLQRTFRALRNARATFTPQDIRPPGWYNGFYGSVRFPGVWGARVPFAVVPSSLATAKAVQVMINYWKLPRPELIISITGGAGDLHSPAAMQEIIERNLARVSDITRAWIVTGGTDSGVMKMAGAALYQFGMQAFPGDHPPTTRDTQRTSALTCACAALVPSQRR